jgi:hypothetical protein
MDNETVRAVTWLPSTDSNIIYSPAQGIIITNATKDKSWKSVSSPQSIWVWILLAIVLICMVGIIVAIGVYFFSKK